MHGSGWQWLRRWRRPWLTGLLTTHERQQMPPSHGPQCCGTAGSRGQRSQACTPTCGPHMWIRLGGGKEVSLLCGDNTRTSAHTVAENPSNNCGMIFQLLSHLIHDFQGLTGEQHYIIQYCVCIHKTHTVDAHDHVDNATMPFHL